ncbi:MAG: hypothetical protein R3F35_09510 [Myxococcota bacterium]
MSARRRWLLFSLPLLGLVLGLGLSGAARVEAGPSVDLHQLHWYVHVDLVDLGSGRGLDYWQGVIDDAMARGSELLEGRNGPFDRACCVRLTRTASVSTFGTPGDGRDVMDTLADQNYFNTAGGSGSNAFLIDSMSYCGGSAPGSIGCAERPSCNSNANDDPNLWMVVTVEALDDGVLSAVVAHERGHNACLVHVAAAECQLMQASVFTPGVAGCLAASECTNYRNARTTSSSGLECACLDSGSLPLADGALCSASPLALCSGGLCDETLGEGATRLIAAAAPGTAGGGPPDDAIAISTRSGSWSTLAQLTPTADDVRGLEYAHDGGTLYGVVPTIGDDQIVTIDPATGLVLEVVGTLANGTDEIVSMAYDPGPTSAPGDDRLLVLEVGTNDIGTLRAISPASPGTSTALGTLRWSPASLFTGLAYDSVHQKLFAASPFGPDGLFEIDLSTCPPSPCESDQVPGAGLFRQDASLSFSPATGMLYLVGTAYSGERTFYDVVDPLTGVSAVTLSLDTFTPAALAAVPEPIGTISWLAGVAGVIVAYRARHSRSSRAETAVVAVGARSRGAEDTEMRWTIFKALGGFALGLALAALVGCGQSDEGGSQSATEAAQKAMGDVAAGVKDAADSVGEGAERMGQQAQEAAASAGQMASDAAAGARGAAAAAGAAIESAGASAATAVDDATKAAGEAVDSAATAAGEAADSAKAGVADAVDQAGKAASDAGAAAAGATSNALDAAAREADAARKALEQPAQ